MTTQMIISKLNWRQIIIHLAAAWFFMHAFLTLAYLKDIEVVDIIRREGSENALNNSAEYGVTITRILNMAVWGGLGSTVGLFVAFIVSVIISIRKHWHWINSVVVLVVAYLLSWFGLTGWVYLKEVLLTPGTIFRDTIWEFLTNGLLLLAIGIFLFSWRKVNDFIGGKRVNPTFQ